MKRPPNLISNSSLVQETLDLLRECGGRASFLEIADRVLQLTNSSEELAAAMVSDLLENDLRFRVEAKHLAIRDDGIENRPLNEIDFVVVDVEAIASRSAPTRVIEIGACRAFDGKITDEFQTLVNPESPLPRFISGLTGISDEMLRHAPLFADIVASWLEFAGDSVLVAHNSTFDLTLLNQEVARVFPGCRMRNAELCTVQLSRRLTPSLDTHNLDALADHFGFEITERHRAAGDARATARVLLHLFDQLEIHGARTLAEARVFHSPSQPSQPALELALDV